MICKKTCGVALVFLIANIYLMLNTDKYGLMKKYQDSLSPTQKQRYKNVVEERKNISIKGYVLGFTFSLILILMNYFKVGFMDGGKSLKIPGMVCISGAITFLTQYIFYILSPKSDWMVLHLDTREQREEWLKVYRAMQFNYHMGLGVGIVAVIVLSMAFKC